MTFVRDEHYVPCCVLAEVIRREDHGTRDTLAFRAGVCKRTLARVLNDEQKTLNFDSADRIISVGLARPDLWWEPPLRAYYR